MRTAIALVLLTAVANAQPRKSEAEAAYKEGQARFVREDYEGAAAQFKAAYDFDPDPVYLFNIAQAYRFAKKCALAREHYERYLAEAKTASNADAVKSYIAEMDACAKEQEPVAPPPQAHPVEPVEPPVQPVPQAAPEGSRGAGMRTAGIAIGVVGVALVGTGAYFAKRVSDHERGANGVLADCADDWTLDCDRDRKEFDRLGKRDEKIMIGTFVGGGAAIATGVVLFVLGGDKQREAPVAVSPMRGGAVVTVRF